jgi:hypothetical protein
MSRELPFIRLHELHAVHWFLKLRGEVSKRPHQSAQESTTKGQRLLGSPDGAGLNLSVVAVQTIRLADQPNLFRYKKGAKVVQRDADGYADAQWRGVIVDGTWRGDPASGAYKEKETYWIRRDQGDSFEADEPALLTRFDTDADLRDEIREKIRTYALPRSMPPALDRDRRETTGSLQTGGNCAACGHRIRSGEPGVYYMYSHGVYQFDSRCNALWIEVQRQTRSLY